MKAGAIVAAVALGALAGLWYFGRNPATTHAGAASPPPGAARGGGLHQGGVAPAAGSGSTSADVVNYANAGATVAKLGMQVWDWLGSGTEDAPAEDGTELYDTEEA